MRRRLLLSLIGMVAPLVVATPAWAYWSAPSAGAGAAATATLQAPTGVTATTQTGRTVQVAWQASALSTGQAASGYYVTRLDAIGAGAAAACGTSAAAPTTATTCLDSAVPDGTYRYVTTAVFRGWTAASVAGNPVLVDRTAPTIAATVTPTPSANGYNTSTPVSVGLSATDNVGGAGVASITSSLDAAAPVTVAAASTALAVSGQGTHTLTFFATDNAGNVGTTGSQTVRIDSLRPTVTVNQATSQADPTTSSPVHFTATFSEAVSGLSGAGITLSGSAGATTAVLSGSGTTYDIAVSGMTGTGTVVASIAAGKAKDAAGNDNTASTSSDSSVSYTAPDTTAPTVTITSLAAGTGRSLDVGGTAGTAPGDSSTVTVVLCTSSTFPCSSGNTKATLTATVSATTGAWTASSGNVKDPVYARATQGDTAGNIGVSNVAGPISG